MVRRLVFVGSLVLLCSVASAAPQIDTVSQFAAADANGDGEVTREEFLAARAKRFDGLDTNKDGFLSRDEFVAAAPGFRGRLMAPALYGQFDANGDGQISRQEFVSAPTPVFDRADANGDGKITAEEARAIQ